ncbi:hypothetical protein ABZZ79_27715 [Streptomyces sp. NPDC006458]|uniref:hypothetical protein n=1 Tax=Streptomyces sp. NPDC006458 TaxID=3154302 RepID=UPI0033A2FF6B
MPRDENMIAALKRERAIYVNAGDEDRVRQVDESLKHYGYGPDSSSGEQDGPQDRTTPPQQTADQGRTPAKKTAAKKTAAPPAPGEPGPTPPAA